MYNIRILYLLYNIPTHIILFCPQNIYHIRAILLFTSSIAAAQSTEHAAARSTQHAAARSTQHAAARSTQHAAARSTRRAENSAEPPCKLQCL